MKRSLTGWLFFLVATLAATAQNPAAQPTTSLCTLKDGKQVSVQYLPVRVDNGAPNGQVWQPGGKPILLFTQTPLALSGSEIPIGAFSIYLIPSKKTWTLIVNRNVTAGSAYDQKQDLARAAMQMGDLGRKTDALKITLVHAAPRQCNVRVYWGKQAGWVEFKEK